MILIRLISLLLASAGILAVVLGGLAAAQTSIAVALIGGLLALIGVCGIMAARRKCAHCRAYVADKATTCSSCGKTITA